MARLPIPGGDDNTWGNVLNSFLEVSLNSDGSISTTALQQAGGVTSINGISPSSGSVTLSTANLSDTYISGPTNNQVLSYDSVSGKWINQTPSFTAPVTSVEGMTGAVTGLLQATNNLSDLNNTSSARTNLGLGSAATMSAGGASGVATLDSGGNVPASELGNVTANVRYRGSWQANTAYSGNDAVVYDDVLYIATSSFTSGSVFNSANWTQLSYQSTGLPTLSAVADNGVANNGNAASLNSQMQTLASAGFTAARLPAATSAYGLEETLQIPVGFWLIGDGSLSFRSPRTGTNLTSGKYTGTAFVPCVGYTDPGFDIRQDVDTSLGGTSSVSFSSSSSTITDTAIQSSDVGRPVTGYNLTSNLETVPVYVGTVSAGSSFVLVNSSGSPVSPTGTGHALCVGSNYPVSTPVISTGPTVGGLVCLLSNGTSYGSGNGIFGCTINATNSNGTTKANVGLWVAGSGVVVKDCLFLDGVMAGLATVPGTSTGTAQDSRFLNCSWTNNQKQPIVTISGSGGVVTGTSGSPLLSNITTSLTPISGYPQIMAGAANPGGGATFYNGAQVVGTGIPAGTFIAQGGINANGSGTLLLTQAVTGSFTGTDVTIVQPDMLGNSARFASTDLYCTNPHITSGVMVVTGGDLIVLGGNIFGSPSTAVAIDGSTHVGAPDVYVSGNGADSPGAVQFSGTTFGPGPGKSFGSYVRRDSGIVTIVGGILEQDNLTWNSPCFEDNDTDTSYGGFHISGTTAKSSSSTVGYGAVIYRRDGNNNPRSSVEMMFDGGTINASAPLWTGGGVGPQLSGGTGGTPGVAIINNDGVVTTIGTASGATLNSPVVWATTAALPSNSYASGVLTATADGRLSVDGNQVTTGDTLLVKDEATAANNGIYTVTAQGSASAVYTLTRRSDMSSGATISGAVVQVLNGSSNAGQIFTLSGENNTIGTSSLNWGPASLGVNSSVWLTSNSSTLTAAAATQVLATPSLAAGTYMFSVQGVITNTSTGVLDVYLAAASVSGATISPSSLGTSVRIADATNSFAITASPVTITAAGSIGLYVYPSSGMTGTVVKYQNQGGATPAFSVTGISWQQVA